MATAKTPRYEAHITDEWERDTAVIQVRKVTHTGHTIAVGQVAEDRDGMPFMYFQAMTPEQIDGREHLVPTPGIRLPHEVATLMARAILTDAGKDADEVERLKAQVETMAEVVSHQERTILGLEAERDTLRHVNDLQALLVEAKDAHLEREVRTANHFHTTVEHDRRAEDFTQAMVHHPARTVSAADLGLD